jgi:1,4-dihydroxy-2-naphthoyl-CoA synthase
MPETKKSKYFQVFNHSSGQWVKCDRELASVVGSQKEKYADIRVSQVDKGWGSLIPAKKVSTNPHLRKNAEVWWDKRVSFSSKMMHQIDLLNLGMADEDRGYPCSKNLFRNLEKDTQNAIVKLYKAYGGE